MQNAAISIECFPGQDRPVGIRIDRPVHAARVFEGKSPAQVLQLVPMLFAVCGVAQSVAAAHALAAAAGEKPAPALERARGALVRVEIAREHLWRALIDWPRFVRYEPHADAFTTMQSLMPRARKALFVDGVIDPRETVHVDRRALDALLADLDRLLEVEVIGIAPAEWLALGAREDLEDYRARASGVVPTLLGMTASAGWDSTCAGSGEFLPRMAFAELEKEFVNGSADQFVELPDWQGRPRETSPLSRLQGTPLLDALTNGGAAGLLVRVIAAVTELAATSSDVRAILDGVLEPGVEAARVAPGTGIAQVEAARGRLVHRAVVEDEVVAGYRIVAPTEWNFHPGGIVSRVLGELSGGDREGVRNQADLFVTLMDPCVAHSVEVH